MSAGRDPYKYFRIEARELLEGLSQGVLELEKAPESKDVVARLLRLAHTLKGASRVVRLGEIADDAHTIETILSPYRTGQAAVVREQVESLLGLLDGIGSRLSTIDLAPDVGMQRAPSATPEEPFETVRVELGEMDGLLDALDEASLHLRGLRRQDDELQRIHELADALVDRLDPRAPGSAMADARSSADALRAAAQRLRQGWRTGIDGLTAKVAHLRERAGGLRLLPASVVFASLERAARDAATSTKKTVDFQVSGGTTRLDAHVLGSLRDALLHVVRNAVVHGIEPESERIRLGKPAAGRIRLTVERVGNRAAFRCTDDGRGVDVGAIAQAAVRAGVLPVASSASLTPKEAFRMLLRGGLTTTPTVTDLSGRGIGLDVVREVASRLKGAVSVHSEPARGTTFEMLVPVSLSSLPALIVESAGVCSAVAFDAVQTTMRLPAGQIARSADGDSIAFEGRIVPFVRLVDVLGGSGAHAPWDEKTWSVVIVRAGDDLAAVGVERVRGIANVVVRSLPAHAAVETIVAGASLDDNGGLQIVLDPNALVLAVRAARSAPGKPDARKAPVLIVDDSLTTRMLEQSILEAAGYEVDLAVSAEEALEKAHRGRYSLFLVDVEMPGMDGFEFVAKTRSDALLRDTPAILVTSRASPEDRRRGQQVGARAYIAKGEFDQASLLRTIRTLLN